MPGARKGRGGSSPPDPTTCTRVAQLAEQPIPNRQVWRFDPSPVCHFLGRCWSPADQARLLSDAPHKGTWVQIPLFPPLKPRARLENAWPRKGSGGSTPPVAATWDDIGESVPILALLAACHHLPSAELGPEPDSAPIAGPPTTCDGAPSAWARLQVGRDSVVYSLALPQDGKRAAEGLPNVRDALAVELGVPTAATPPVTIWLTTASTSVRSGTAMTVSTRESADAYFVSPICAMDPRPRQFEKELVEELSGEYLQAATTSDSQGWTFYSAPPWFVQGAEQWLTTRVHDRPEDVHSTAIERACRPPDGAITLGGTGVEVHEVYRDGEALVAWLTIEFGPDIVSRLLANDAATFDAALREETRLDASTLTTGYWRWRAEQRQMLDAP